MLTNCFRFAPRDSVPGLIAKICKYLKDHPGWSEEELEEQIKQFIGRTGVESFNGRTGSVVLNENDYQVRRHTWVRCKFCRITLVLLQLSENLIFLNLKDFS